MTIEIIELDELDSLYHRYPNQINPQPCYLELDPEERTVKADWDGEIGGAAPMSVWHKRKYRYSIPILTATAANHLMRALLPLLEKVCAAYSCEWDGSNYVGKLDLDPQETIELEARIDESCGYAPYRLQGRICKSPVATCLAQGAAGTGGHGYHT